jgi:hypothetical protein
VSRVLIPCEDKGKLGAIGDVELSINHVELIANGRRANSETLKEQIEFIEN